MIVAYISSSTLPSRQANSIHVMKMSQAIAKLGIKVYLFAPKMIKPINDPKNDLHKFYGVKDIFSVQPPLKYNLPGKSVVYALSASLRAKLLGADIVYCRNIFACYLSILLRNNVIIELHSVLINPNWFQRFVFKTIVHSKYVKKIVVISDALKQKLLSSHHALSENKLIVAHDGADAVDQNANLINLLGSGFKVGYVGHLYKGRGVDILIELAKLCEWADFHFVGGTEKDIQYWKSITKNMANAYFHGFVQPSLTDSYRLSFDVLVAPYQHNVKTAGGDDTTKWMSPLKIFEYMAARKPIICSDLPVLREVLNEGNALFCEPEKVSDWKEKLELLRDNQALRIRISNNSYSDFISYYSWDARAKKILDSI